jgi:hypothetical protein
MAASNQARPLTGRSKLAVSDTSTWRNEKSHRNPAWRSVSVNGDGIGDNSGAARPADARPTRTHKRYATAGSSTAGETVVDGPIADACPVELGFHPLVAVDVHPQRIRRVPTSLTSIGPTRRPKHRNTTDQGPRLAGDT